MLRGFYRKHPESVEISLVSMGETAQETRPTILAICTSVEKVKGILKKYFSYDKSAYDLKVRKGKVLRSRKKHLPCRSMADTLDIHGLEPAANTDHQIFPHFGASIGACVEGRNLPPVSFGGTVEIDGVVYGMSVHHMLDEDNDSDDIDEFEARFPHRSSGFGAGSYSNEGSYHPNEDFYYSSDDVIQSGLEPEYSYEYETADEDNETDLFLPLEPGDKEGIPVDCGDGYYVTQPAIDDVSDEFFTSSDERDEEHINSHGLGEISASSGIRRTKANGQVHEIDWALFTFNKDRHPPPDLIQEGQRRFCKDKPSYPSGIVPCSELRDLSVHSMGRSSGLCAGKISAGMTSVKIYGRKTPSQSYEVKCTEKAGNMLGIPGDSGAWIIENETARVCGTVLAWSSRKRVAYISPMDIQLEDIAKVLDAGKVSLASGEVVYERETSGSSTRQLVPPLVIFSVGSIGILPERRTTVPVSNDLDSDAFKVDSDGDDADDEDEDRHDNDDNNKDKDGAKTIQNTTLSLRPPMLPICINDNNNQRERQLPTHDLDPIPAAIDKMRITADITALGDLERIRVPNNPIAGGIK